MSRIDLCDVKYILWIFPHFIWLCWHLGAPVPNQDAGILWCIQATSLDSHCIVSCHCVLAEVVVRGEVSWRMTAEWGEERLRRGQGIPDLCVPAGSQKCQKKVENTEVDTALKGLMAKFPQSFISGLYVASSNDYLDEDLGTPLHLLI